MNVIRIARIKDFERQTRQLHLRGGRPERIARRVLEIVGAATVNPSRGLSDYRLTNHGESRLRHCMKYDLGDGYRLVTVQTDGFIVFCFVGDHEETDRWLDRHRGKEFTVDATGGVEYVHSSVDIESPENRIVTSTDYASGTLFERLPPERLDALTDTVPASVLRSLLLLETISTDDEIQARALGIPNEEQAIAVFDVLLHLRDGNVAEAERRIDLYLGASRIIASLSEEEVVEVRDGETVKMLPVSSPEYLAWVDQLLRHAPYHEWMLFMHPEQQSIVERDFDGPAKLSGVSGSGKTSIVVKRAIRLAGSSGGRRVLVLTLNRSLAMLIRRLVDYAAVTDEIRERVHVKSLFELCQELLHRFEPQNQRLYNDVTWKNEEHIDEIWREFYRCHNNNRDAAVLIEIHKSLGARKVSGEVYMRQEFDWVRSAFRLVDREAAYPRAERNGRAIPLLQHWRRAVLDGLRGWEAKMRDVGVTDHLGLACSLEPYLDAIAPEYGAVLVDEVQDFGTVELSIARQLVAPGKNDLFLCGDLAQRVQTKHQSMREAGVEVPGGRSLAIRRNYRNSREILRAAYEVLRKAVPELHELQGEVELLDPQLSNFSTSAPLVLEGPDLEAEFGAALDISRHDTREEGRTACIAFAGFSLRDIQKFGIRVGLPVLDGTKGLEEGGIFLSDLEQTKGYEFDTISRSRREFHPHPRDYSGDRGIQAELGDDQLLQQLFHACQGHPEEA